MNKGTLYLIPSLIADSSIKAVIPNETLSIIRRLEHFIVEEIRTSRRFLISAGIKKPVDELEFKVFNEHSDPAEILSCLWAAMEGHDIGLLSDAGVPCVADPGSFIVREAHQQGIRVMPLTGPSSILLALMASGFNGQHFIFHGYLPADKTLLVKKIREIEKAIADEDQTQIFIETPYRNIKLFEILVKTCKASTQLCLAAGITGKREIIHTDSISAWRELKPDIHKLPTIFLLYH